ncbi:MULTISPECIES: glycosyltransferase family 39 protein [Thermocrispum]|jgi:4-amino-4-deoxy-L-arabinose transferase-like glycosyltransferase|nr:MULTISPECIES: glycosyltransferase family 39 protein [Thermocrispum]
MIVAVAGLVSAVLVLFAHEYGYHRDELYFIAAGKRLDWAYVDQGPVTPLLARLMTELDADSLTLLRLPSALAAGLIVLITGLLAGELGAKRSAQVLAAVIAGVSVVVLFNGHLLSTTTFDLLCWTAATWLIVRAVLRDERLWLAVGLVVGLGLLNKPLPALLAVAVLVSLLAAGPRHVLRSPYPWLGAMIAVVLFAPFILWQAAHGWPHLEVSAAIARGESASSEPWWAVVPFQLLLVSPVLAPVWIAGLVRLFRDAELRFLAVTWVLLAVVFMATGGKPYYLAGMLPLLVAAGCVPIPRWLRGRPPLLRKAALGLALAASIVIDPVIALPVLPVRDIDLVVAMNEDVGETVGWPELVSTVAHAHQDGAVIFTRNYGEAGAIDRFGPAYGLPQAYSGHNAYWHWGPPPDLASRVVVVGIPAERASRFFVGCTTAATIGNDAGVDNEENGAPVLFCAGPSRPWSQMWPELRRMG